MSAITKPEFYWHIHHEILCEALIEPIQNRIDYIKKYKDPSEVETRLRLMTPVLHPEKLPVKWKADVKWEEAYVKWKEAYVKWERAYVKLEEAYVKWKEAKLKWEEAYVKWKEAYVKWGPQIEALHKEEHPDCPWNGRTIFP